MHATKIAWTIMKSFNERPFLPEGITCAGELQTCNYMGSTAKRSGVMISIVPLNTMGCVKLK